MQLGIMAERTREDLLTKINSDHAYWRMNDAASTTLPNSGSVLGDGDIDGTLGTFWSANDPLATTTDYYVTFEDSQYIQYDTAAAHTFARWDTLGSGNMLISMGFYWTDNTPASLSYILSDTMEGHADGGWGLKIASGNFISMAIRDDSAETSYGGINVANISLSAHHHLLLDISPSNDYIHYYVDGTSTGTAGDLSGVTMPACTESAGLVIGGRSRTGLAPVDLLANSESGILLNHLFVMRTTSDISADVATLAAQWTERPYELPVLLENY